jgi:hypothetical protein
MTVVTSIGTNTNQFTLSVSLTAPTVRKINTRLHRHIGVFITAVKAAD